MLIAQYQQVLFPLAYHMMGTVMDAEDLVQDVMADWFIQKEKRSILHDQAYLKKAIIHKAINRKKLLKNRLEKYPGKWLPEPVTWEDYQQVQQRLDQPKSVRYALLVLLEKLSPRERAVFLLKEVAGHSHQEIAGLLEISEENARQLLKRAKNKLGTYRLDSPVASHHHQLVEQLLQAIEQEDVALLQAHCQQQVTADADGGGKRGVASQTIRGPERVARYLVGLRRKFYPDAQLSLVPVNNQWAVIVSRGTVILSCCIPEIAEGLVSQIFIMANPAKLSFKTPLPVVTETIANGLSR